MNRVPRRILIRPPELEAKLAEVRREALAEPAAKGKKKPRSVRHRQGKVRAAKAYRKRWLNSQPLKWRGLLAYHYARCSEGDLDGAWLDYLEAAQPTCPYCACVLTPRNRQLEHARPISRGGTNARENVAFACASCNAHKFTMDHKEYTRHIGAFSIFRSPSDGGRQRHAAPGARLEGDTGGSGVVAGADRKQEAHPVRSSLSSKQPAAAQAAMAMCGPEATRPKR